MSEIVKLLADEYPQEKKRSFNPMTAAFRPTLRSLTLISILTLAAGFALAQGNRVSINADQVLVINGRKVFPIGLTKAPPPGATTPDGRPAYAELREGGAVFMRTGTSGGPWSEATIAEEDRWMAAAAQYGLYCWPFLRELASVREGDAKTEALLRRVVTRFKDHPGLGFWKGEDEPEWGKKKVEPLVRAREIIRELDPNHPLVIMHAPRGTTESLRRYMPAGDVTGADIYPISYPPGIHSLEPNKELSQVGDYTRKMMAVAQGKMPVWMVLQIAWSGVAKPGKTLRYPTLAEERFMVYEAIINGARGLNFFGGNLEVTWAAEDVPYQWNWHFWRRVLRPLLEEINEQSPLHPALVAPDSKMVVKASSPEIELCVREAEGSLFILACKRGGATAQVTFSGVPGAAGEGEGEVLYESPRKVEVKGGSFKDWFAPWEVHVYIFSLPAKK